MNMGKKLNLMIFIGLAGFLFWAPTASANCMWTLNNQCGDISSGNIWTANADSNCGSTVKPNGTTAKCCCAAEVTGCCEKTDSNGGITTANLTGEECKKITYATTIFRQDSKAENNQCVSKTVTYSNCSWKPYQITQAGASGGCSKTEVANSASCSTAQPISASTPGSGVTNGYLCCCQSSVAATTSKPPVFTIPELQIPIDTLTLTKPTCDANTDGTYTCQIPWLSQYILALYNYGLSIAGILAAIMLMAGGLLWLISGGDASKITQAKELIIGSVTGLIILASSYIILMQINPNLTQLYPISIGTIKRQQQELAEKRNDITATDYKNSSCATDAELAAGINFYATGYYKPAWEDSDTFRCVVAMQCSCPLGQDTSKNCDQLYGKTFPGYHPCKAFPSTTAYCNMTASGGEPKDGDIAGPNNCQGNLPYGTQVCFKGKTYTIRDTGGGIKGRRIDIWSGSSLNKALSSTGVGKLTKGACK